jgi:hypothetical protein
MYFGEKKQQDGNSYQGVNNLFDAGVLHRNQVDEDGLNTKRYVP